MCPVPAQGGHHVIRYGNHARFVSFTNYSQPPVTVLVLLKITHDRCGALVSDELGDPEVHAEQAFHNKKSSLVFSWVGFSELLNRL